MSQSLTIDVQNVVKQNTPLRNVPSGSTSEPDYSVKYVAQSLTEEQKAQARANIGAAAAGETGGTSIKTYHVTDNSIDPTTDEVTINVDKLPESGDVLVLVWDAEVGNAVASGIIFTDGTDSIVLTIKNEGQGYGDEIYPAVGTAWTVRFEYNIEEGDVLGGGYVIGTSATQADWNETDTYSPAYIKNKPVISAPVLDKYEMPFYIENLDNVDNTSAVIQSVWSDDTPEIEISNDNVSWRDGGGGTGVKTISLTIPANGRLYIKTKTYPGISTGHSFSNLGNCNLGGNILSLRRPDFIGVMDDNERFYGGGFSSNRGIVDASNLGMPRGNIGGAAWGQGMFQNCTALKKAPELPARTVGQQAYERMFSGCASLQEAPALPATSLSSSCYNEMFNNCSSLLKAPALPATSVPSQAYRKMFANCSLLNEAPALPATSLGGYSYTEMFGGCTSLVVGPSIAKGQIIEYDTNFQQFLDGCSSIRSIAELRLSNLTGTEIYYMLHNCSSLHEIYCHATNIVSPNFGLCFEGLASTGTFYCASGMKTTWESLNAIPSGWTIVEM